MNSSIWNICRLFTILYDEPVLIKEEFFKKRVITNIENMREIIILGDFNSPIKNKQ